MLTLRFRFELQYQDHVVRSLHSPGSVNSTRYAHKLPGAGLVNAGVWILPEEGVVVVIGLRFDQGRVRRRALMNMLFCWLLIR